MTPVSMKEEFSKETTKVATGSRIDEMGGCRCQFFLEGNLSLFELACSLSRSCFQWRFSSLLRGNWNATMEKSFSRAMRELVSTSCVMIRGTLTLTQLQKGKVGWPIGCFALAIFLLTYSVKELLPHFLFLVSVCCLSPVNWWPDLQMKTLLARGRQEVQCKVRLRMNGIGMMISFRDVVFWTTRLTNGEKMIFCFLVCFVSFSGNCLQVRKTSSCNQCYSTNDPRTISSMVCASVMLTTK